ncbi:MAG: hypothetical protein JW821_17230 [Deltaproteobacteria bacterium]|nr:hypothetical protein [Deltaproteobacteria bacterium]
MKERTIIGLIGIAVTLIGWIGSNAERFPFVYGMIVPEYSNAVKALGKMTKEGHLLKSGDPGFAEISEILRMLAPNTDSGRILVIRSLSREGEPPKGGEVTGPEGTIKLEIGFAGGLHEDREVAGLKAAIEKRFLVLNIFLWSGLIFGIGILISLIALFVKEEQRRE